MIVKRMRSEMILTVTSKRASRDNTVGKGNVGNDDVSFEADC